MWSNPCFHSYYICVRLLTMIKVKHLMTFGSKWFLVTSAHTSLDLRFLFNIRKYMQYWECTKGTKVFVCIILLPHPEVE